MPGKTANAGGLLLSASSSAHSPACTDAVLCRKAAHNLLISLNFELDVSKNRRTVIFYCQMPHQGVHKASGSDSMRLALGEGFPSGQRDQTVNLTALPSKVRILLPPPSFRKPGLAPGFRISGLPNPLFLCPPAPYRCLPAANRAIKNGRSAPPVYVHISPVTG